jgi:hypothetical protein
MHPGSDDVVASRSDWRPCRSLPSNLQTASVTVTTVATLSPSMFCKAASVAMASVEPEHALVDGALNAVTSFLRRQEVQRVLLHNAEASR